MSTKTLTRNGSTLPTVFEDFFKPWNEWVNGGSLWNNVMTVPAVNVTEKNSHYLITLAAPGLTKDEFDISMDGNMMTISAEPIVGSIKSAGVGAAATASTPTSSMPIHAGDPRNISMAKAS